MTAHYPRKHFLLIALTLSLTVFASTTATAGNKAPRSPSAAEQLVRNVAKELRRTAYILHKGLNQPDVSPALRRRIMRTFRHGAVKLNQATRQAQKDGVITKREARHVRNLARQLRAELTRQLRPLHRKKPKRAGRFVDGRRDGSGRFNHSRKNRKH